MNKNIFKYFNGSKEVFADPSEIDYQLIRNSETEDLSTIIENLAPETNVPGNEENEYKLRTIAAHQLDPIVRASFGIEPFNVETGEGMTIGDVITLYANYLEWRNEVKKNIDSQPTSATHTDSHESSLTESTITPVSTASYSTRGVARR